MIPASVNCGISMGTDKGTNGNTVDKRSHRGQQKAWCKLTGGTPFSVLLSQEGF